MTDIRTPRRATHVAWILEGERVYAVAPAGPEPFTVVEFSETASSIWLHVDGDTDVPSIVRAVADDWGIATDEVAEGVRSFLRQLTDQHLIAWDAAAGEHPASASM